MEREDFTARHLASWPTGQDIRPKCGFRIRLTTGEKVLLAGIQEGNTERYERAWGLDTTGGWIGPPPMTEFPRDVRLPGMTQEQQGVDAVFRVPSGSAFMMTWNMARSPYNFWPADIISDNGAGCYWFIRECALGEIILQGNSPTLPLQIDALPDGSYVLFCQAVRQAEEIRLPPGYNQVPEFYYYEGDHEYYYDPVFNIGRFPADANSELAQLREQLTRENKIQDKNEWVKYLIAAWPQTSEWSGVKFVVGEGEWHAAPGVGIAPGRALEWLDTETPQSASPSTRTPIYFDPMARMVTFAYHTRAGRTLVGGSRISPNGVATALWEITPGDSIASTSIDLLALDFSYTRPWCECWISDHTVTGIVELETPEQEIIVSNLCKIYRLDETVSVLEERLKPEPDYTDGDPGGRCLVQTGALWAIMTEQAGQPQPSGGFAGFYNCTLQYVARQRDISNGTAFHGESCAVRHLGKMYGVKQDSPFADPAARQYICWHDRTWDKSTFPSFLAREVNLQRLGSANGVLYVQGKEAHSEQAVMVVADGNYLTTYNFGYRLRQITATLSEREGYDALLACGRASTVAEIDATWKLVEFGQPSFHDDEPQNAGEAQDILNAEGVLRRTVQLPGRTLAVNVIDGDNECALAQWDKAMRQAQGWDAGFTVWARVDSNAPVDDLESYVIRVPYQRRLALPGAGAYNQLDVLFFVPTALQHVQLPGVYVR